MLNVLVVLSLVAIFGTGMVFTSTAEETDILEEIQAYYNEIKQQKHQEPQTQQYSETSTSNHLDLQAIRLNEVVKPEFDNYSCWFIHTFTSIFPDGNDLEICYGWNYGINGDEVYYVRTPTELYKMGDIAMFIVDRLPFFDYDTYEDVDYGSEYVSMTVFDHKDNVVIGPVLVDTEPYDELKSFYIELDDGRFNAGEYYDVLIIYKSPFLELKYGPAMLDRFHILAESEQDPTLEPEPQTGIQGKVYTDTNDNDRYDAGEPLLSGMSVLSINLSDHSDTVRDRTNTNGEYFIEREAGNYLVQVEFTNSFAYLDVRTGSVTTQNLSVP